LGGGGQTFYVGGIGGYDDVDEEMDVQCERSEHSCERSEQALRRS